MSTFDLDYTRAGTVIGSYISGATVTISTLDETTIYGTTTTDDSGNFEFSFADNVVPDTLVLLTVEGGTDILTDEPFSGSFSTIVNAGLGTIQSNTNNITSLTTLLANSIMDSLISSDTV